MKKPLTVSEVETLRLISADPVAFIRSKARERVWLFFIALVAGVLIGLSNGIVIGIVCF